jgi:cyclopropane fatty-acyl-phospholipid synthase-like methyltransferase
MRKQLVSILLLLGCAAAPACGGHPGPDAAQHHHEGPIGHRFEDAERWARHFDDPTRDAWQKPEHVVDVLEIAPGMVVADIGAGTGYFLPYLSPAVGPDGTVLALDVEPDMVRYMEERAQREGLHNVQARRVEPSDPGLVAAGVDRILIVDTWHHIAQREAYAAKLAAALAPGGRVAIVDFTQESPRGPPRAHRVRPDQAARELEAGGLVAHIAAEDLPDQYVVVGEK